MFRINSRYRIRSDTTIEFTYANRTQFFNNFFADRLDYLSYKTLDSIQCFRNQEDVCR